MEPTLKFCSTFYLQYAMTSHDKPSAIIFRLGSLVRHISLPEFGATLSLYTEEFMSTENFFRLHQQIYYFPSYCWTNLTASTTPYNASRSKVTSLSPALQYLHALLAHTLTSRRESTSVVSTTDAYCLWSMATGHIFDLAYFIALAFRHQTDRHRKCPICLGPYVTRLARHFGLLNTPEQSSTLTLVSQMSPQGISTMIHMRMIERLRGVDPPQYRLLHSDSQNDPKDFTDDIPLHHDDPPHPPSSSHRPVSFASILTDLFERFTRFE
ncbi:hypothetical protein J1N35_027078 [Gossypium stocksii]|uniref:Arabidopsis retrotransposon Orf1 C-terminal domain-containing protein n=1 Tax=Gossypium stocksii TaxID=47602 RepID=A0A9D3V9R6_9ROSI|nr:hypothetical protein J1N35_027078 [Gossypium stocksii]